MLSLTSWSLATQRFNAFFGGIITESLVSAIRSQLRHLLLATSLWGNRKKETQAKEAIMLCAALHGFRLKGWNCLLIFVTLAYLLCCPCLFASLLTFVAASWSFETVQGCLLECSVASQKRLSAAYQLPLTTRFPLAVGKGKGDAGRRWACSKTFTDWFKNAPPWQVWYPLCLIPVLVF